MTLFLGLQATAETECGRYVGTAKAADALAIMRQDVVRIGKGSLDFHMYAN